MRIEFSAFSLIHSLKQFCFSSLWDDEQSVSDTLYNKGGLFSFIMVDNISFIMKVIQIQI